MVKEGPFKEPSYYYPGDKVQAFLRNLSATECYENPSLPPLSQKIAILTHDDQFDPMMFQIETSCGIQSTWFLLSKEVNEEIPKGIDVHLHFDKETGTLKEQISVFRSRLGRNPQFNRNHRLLWRANNFDFPLLALYGISVDTTLIGTRPFRPTIHGKVLPIWEIPFCITDKTNRFMASYSVAADYEIPFKRGLSPIVILSHPFAVCTRYQLQSCFHEVLHLIERYEYQSMNMTTFYDQFLRDFFPLVDKVKREGDEEVGMTNVPPPRS